MRISAWLRDNCRFASEIAARWPIYCAIDSSGTIIQIAATFLGTDHADAVVFAEMDGLKQLLESDGFRPTMHFPVKQELDKNDIRRIAAIVSKAGYEIENMKKWTVDMNLPYPKGQQFSIYDFCQKYGLKQVEL